MRVLELVPSLIVPLIVIDMIGARRVVGTGLAVEGKGIGLHDAVVPRGLDAVFVAAELPESLYKQLPDAGVGDAIHEVGVGIPVVEIADYGNRFCVRRPNSENNALTAVPVFKVRTKEVVGSCSLTLQKLLQGGSCVVN